MNPNGRPITPLPDRFWPKVQKTSTCWLWTGRVDPLGYGRFHINNKTTGKSKLLLAHRLSWELVKGGPAPEDMTLDHLCRVRHCVNPDHLEIVTNVENVLRGIGPSAINKRKTHCKNGHPFSVENTAYLHDGRHRVCKQCARNRDRIVYYAGKKKSRKQRREEKIMSQLISGAELLMSLQSERPLIFESAD